MRVNTHLCLVSAQPTPNLTPALDPTVAPRRVLLLVSPDMLRRAGWLESVLTVRGVHVETWPIEDAWNIEHVQHRLVHLLERKKMLVARADIALNATGGTKPMSIAAYEVFRRSDLPIFYIHPEQDRLIWMHPSGRAPLDLANRVTLDAFFQAHGARQQSAKTTVIPQERRALTDWLVTQSTRLAPALGTINWLAMKSTRTLISPVLTAEQRHDMALTDILGRCAGAGLLNIRAGQVHFASEAARFYVNGGWLEEHVYAVFQEFGHAERGIQDLARSVEISRDDPRGGEILNEIDVACLAENRLYLVECKTRRWKSKDSPGADTLYRLDALSDLLGGLQGRALLVSYLDLPDHVRRRAKDLRISICAGERLSVLHDVIAGWLP